MKTKTRTLPEPTDFVTVLVALGPEVSIVDYHRELQKRRLGLIGAADVLGDLCAHKSIRVVDKMVIWDPLVLHRLTLDVQENSLAQSVALRDRYAILNSEHEFNNGLRWLFYLNLPGPFRTLMKSAPYYYNTDIWLEPFRAYLDVDWLSRLDRALQLELFTGLLPSWWSAGQLPSKVAPLLSGGDGFLPLEVDLAVMQGNLDLAEALVGTNKEMLALGYWEWLLLLRGDAKAAHQGFVKRVSKRKPNVACLAPLPALFARVAALRVGDIKGSFDGRYDSPAYPALDHFIREVAGSVHDTGEKSPHQSDVYLKPLPGLELCLVTALEPLLDQRHPERDLAGARNRLESLGLVGLSRQLEDVSPEDRPPTHWGHGLHRQESWEYFLAALKVRGQQSIQPVAKQEVQRLVWVLHPPHSVQPVRQKRGKSGWIGATSASWKSLTDSPPDFLIEQDRVALGKLNRSLRYGRLELSYDEEFFKALVGHPNLQYEEQTCELLPMPLQVRLNSTKTGIRLQVYPPMSALYHMEVLEPGKIGLCCPTAHQRELFLLLGKPQELPLKAREKLLESLEPWLDKVELSYGKGVQPLLPTRLGETAVVVQLRPLRQGLRVSLRVRPLGVEGPLFRAGQGPAQETLRWNQQTLLVKRDLELEGNVLRDLLRDCPALYESDDQEMTEPEEALEALLQLQSAGALLEWPEGKAWTVRTASPSRQLRLQAQQRESWFELQGQLTVDDGQVLQLGRLLELSQDSKGRFLRLQEGEFLALTDELKQKLAALDELVEPVRKQLRFPMLAVPSLAELDQQLQSDAAFGKALDRFRAAEDLRPGVPAGITADLRDYQVEGYQWICQRAEVGAGICLADDMGLGKTLQTIAWLVRASVHGPQLVLCPTSVSSNWHDQITRFAPELRPVYLEGKQRAQRLAELEAGDVVIASYRILLQDRAGLLEFDWNTLVLDEAQFIKNPESKTARAAFELKARTRIATTGTPIENRLSELWSIFRFLNPGLLGTLSSFRRRFEGPVLAGQSGPRQRLRRLVAPFIMRRTKAQVLSELPPRTDISLSVELNSDERALYEDIRRQAQSELEHRTGQFQLLAHLTRLRQACCHPRLLMPQQDLVSSKFEAFFQLAEDLVGGKHRTLVFSQFVQLLKLLERELQQRGHKSLYLDGSTPVAERRQLVESFQAGEGDFFLISLKAGGTGLNLTGADYVVHLDPWWNPAVEDQASDRAHRIGQTRPVTVYRLIASNTIEEKVVKLHGQKRELAQGVLDGADGQNTLSSQELLDLLAE